MALEMQIISPKPEQKFPVIKWNHEELKAEVAAAVKDYQNLVVTVESEKDCKDTRAKLNKLRTALETARKDMKKRVTEPLTLFEAQVREVEAPIDSAINNLDKQLAEIKTMRQEQKRQSIREAYEKCVAPEWLSLEQIWDEKWLNVSVSMDQVIKAIDEKISHINSNLSVIANLPEFAFEAEEYYKRTLDFKMAIEKAKEAAEIQKRKAAAEAAKTMQDNPRNGEQEQPVKTETQEVPEEGAKQPLNGTETAEPIKYTFRFEISVTADQAAALGMFCRNQGIELKRI